VQIRTWLTHGDLLESAAGQRHGGAVLSLGEDLAGDRCCETCGI